jgi:hypothetical protein
MSGVPTQRDSTCVSLVQKERQMNKKMKIVRLLLSLAITTQVCSLRAQGDVQLDSASSGEFSLNGSLDSYFHKSFGTVEQAPRTSFSNLPGFSVGMINLVAWYTSKKSGFVADLVFGPRGSDAVFNAPLYRNASGGSSSQIINQMYAYYQLSSRVKMSLGQFNTFLSYEFISPVKNFHYSTSYLFSYGPFNHTGLWTDIDLLNGWTAKLAIMNPTDFTEFNPFGAYILGGQLGYSTEGKSFYLNTTIGDPDGKLTASDSVGTSSVGRAMHIDLTASWDVTAKYNIGLSASYKTIQPGEVKTVTDAQQSTLKDYGFYGLILYQKLALDDSFILGLRTEYFGEFQNGVGALGTYSVSGKASVLSGTLSGNITAGGFKLIPELRIDKTSEGSFTSRTTGESVNQMASVNLAVVYTIPTLTYRNR